MNENKTTITTFYTALANADASRMSECYHPDVLFRYPIFGELKGNHVFLMWKMLLESGKENFKISFSVVKSNTHVGSATWIANYRFSKTNNPVCNIISSQFYFKDGLIIKQVDDFDLWKWSKQALGIKGMLLGWTGFVQNKIQQQAQASLKKYIEKTHSSH
jgi:ketosteroid isomerase-like protein